jgi:hypothetical protein
MKYFYIIKDGFINCAGCTSDIAIPKDAVEITKQQFNQLAEYIKEQKKISVDQNDNFVIIDPNELLEG